MGFFSKLFKSGPTLKDLSALAKNASDGLEEIRRYWFNSCVEALQQELTVQKEVQILNTQIEGDADYAIRAYQLNIFFHFLIQHSYMSPSMTKSFASILSKQVFGSKLKECKPYWDRYETEEVQRLIRFCSDVAKHITGLETPLAEAMFLSARCFPLLFTGTHMCVAETFGDRKTVQQLDENFKKVRENSAKNWNEAIPMLNELYEDEKQEKPQGS